MDLATVVEPSSSGQGNASESYAAETSNKENKGNKSSQVSGAAAESSVSIDDEFDFLFEEESVDFTKSLKKEDSSQGKMKSQEAQNTSMLHSSNLQGIGEKYKSGCLTQFSYKSKKEDNTAASHFSSPHTKGQKDSGFLSQFRYKPKEVDEGKAAGIAQEQKSTFPDLTSCKNRGRRGIQFKYDLEVEENTNEKTESSFTDKLSLKAEKTDKQSTSSDTKTRKTASMEECEQILARKREAKGGQWIDARKMQKKLKTFKF